VGKNNVSEAAVCCSRCLIYIGFKIRIINNDTCMNKSTRVHSHTYKYTNAELQNSYFTTRQAVFFVAMKGWILLHFVAMLEW